MLLKDIITGLKVKHVNGDVNIDIEGISYDSRTVKKGFLFICKGFNFEEKYIYDAIDRGATAIMTEDESININDITVIVVENTRYALAYVSDLFYGHPSEKLNIIGITGTKGKTTTSYMIKSIMEADSHKVGLIGTIRNMIGDRELKTDRTTPEALDLQQLFSEMIDEGVDCGVMEVSSHALELDRVSCIDFDTAIFTNLSRDHLDFHKTFENYINAKAKLFRMCKTGIVNIDNEYGSKIIEQASCNIYTFGIDKNADITAENIIYNSDSVEFFIKTPWGNGNLKVGIPGKFTVYNALGAAAACMASGIPINSVAKGLEKVSVPGRAEIIETGRNFVVMIDYAHSPDSLENILKTVREFAKGRLICVFGCGGDRDKTKRPIMGEISGRLADFTVITSDNPRTEDPDAIINDIEQGLKNTSYPYVKITDRREAIKFSLGNAKENDIIVLAGKGHETYQQFKDKTIHFDEREVVRELLEELDKEEAEKRI
mgnify:CR=1 FL=1